MDKRWHFLVIKRWRCFENIAAHELISWLSFHSEIWAYAHLFNPTSGQPWIELDLAQVITVLACVASIATIACKERINAFLGQIRRKIRTHLVFMLAMTYLAKKCINTFLLCCCCCWSDICQNSNYLGQIQLDPRLPWGGIEEMGISPYFTMKGYP